MEMSNLKPPTPEELRRLSLVRHLYGIGVVQSRGAEPTAGLSILPLHDSAEAFLQLACERYDAGENKADFMRYWELLSAKGIAVFERETMRQLNVARRSLKHQGILPAHVELEGFRAAVTNLLYGSSVALFGIEFDKITQVSLVSDPVSRGKIEAAYKAFEMKDHQSALGLAAAAFILVRRARDEVRTSSLPSQMPASLWAKTTQSSFSNFAIRDVERSLGRDIARSLTRLTDDTNRSVQVLSEAIDMVSSGLDINDFMFFSAYTPIVHQMIGGALTIDWLKEPTDDPAVVSRCLDFLVSAAIRFGV